MKNNKINTNVARLMIEKRLLDVACGEEFDISVTNSLMVANCDDLTDTEQEIMMRGILRKWRIEADSMCSNLNACPYPTLVKMDVLSSGCKDKIWTVIASVTGKCEQ